MSRLHRVTVPTPCASTEPAPSLTGPLHPSPQHPQTVPFASPRHSPFVSPQHSKGICFLLSALALALNLTSFPARAQAKYTATGPGSYLQLGVEISGLHAQYGQRYVAGPSAFLDAHLYRRLGLEAEVRTLNLHTDEGVRQTTYLVGPKLTILPHRMRPFIKLLAGRGDFRFPYGYAQGSYLVVAPGAGLDYRLGESRWSLRLLDAEYQLWPGFTFGQLRNYAASTGITYRLK